MARLLFPSSAESVTCLRCGNSILSDAETCPHCGADHGGVRTSGQAEGIPNGLRLFAARRASMATPSPYPSVPEEAEFAGTGEQRWDNSKSVTLGAVMLALIAGGVIYSQSGDRDGTKAETPAGHSAYGAIDMKAARAVTAPAPVVQPAAIAAAQPAPAPVSAAPAVDTSARVPATSAAAIDNLQAARDAIERADLTTARRRFSKIPAAQLSAGNMQRTQSELANLERTRDNLLQMARSCEATGSWICVRQNARDVLAIDASNVEAQTLVEHAITRSGWLNKTAPPTARATPKSSVPTPLAATPASPSPSPSSSARKVVSVPSAPLRPIPVMPATVATSTQAAPVASDSTRVSTGSHAPLTSAGDIAAPQAAVSASTSTSSFIPMPDGPETPVARAASPATPAVRTPSLDTQPVTEAVPVRANVSPPSATMIPASQVATNPAPVIVTRTLAAGDNSPNTVQPKTPVRSTTDADAEERAILESGWSKGQSSKQRQTPQ
ncbi:hypothetical protein ASG35_20975 [Burkholderia sp. Leaf177]|uniref:zinc ribbon domain-containing protein n=1 Tax=Burkholderia sp. Leaf177 TaxID=1736287 RepID=UPI0006FE4A7B|nr:zinc ribbon domain-containing protein [Burkholderia sp. Leaf177]KQR74251.1 hypothetical protein ASG35_20975 [Burkholderia sp. Leaf177]